MLLLKHVCIYVLTLPALSKHIWQSPIILISLQMFLGYCLAKSILFKCYKKLIFSCVWYCANFEKIQIFLRGLVYDEDFCIIHKWRWALPKITCIKSYLIWLFLCRYICKCRHKNQKSKMVYILNKVQRKDGYVKKLCKWQLSKVGKSKSFKVEMHIYLCDISKSKVWKLSLLLK